MKNLLSARLLALITVPVLISGLVLPTAATAAPLPTIESATITGTVEAGQTLTAHANGVTGATSTDYTWYVANNTANTLYGDSGFTFAYDTVGDGTSSFTIPNQTWWYGKDVYVVITVSNCVVDSEGIDEDPSTCVATAASPYYGDGVTNLGGGVVIPYKANLFDLAISSGTLSTTFNSATTTYTASVSNATTSITVTPSTGTVIPFVDPSDRNATTQVRVNGGDYATVLSGESSNALSLNVGANPIDVKVTAQDGSTTKTYTVTVTRAGSSNADLSGLALSSGTLAPEFASGTTSYTASVANSVATGYTVTPTKIDSNASFVRYLGSSGTTAFSGALAVGANIIRTVVTAEDGTTTKTYTVTVTRAAASAPPINVIFNANNGTGGWKNQFITAGKATPLLSNTYTRTGYTPNGWNTQADGSGTTYTDGQSVTLALNSGLTLFAAWTANPHTVTFNANDGSAGTATQSINSGVATALTANSFTRTGYTFAGWNTNSNGSGTAYTNGQSVTLTSGLNLFARWIAKTNTVFFNSNNGAGNRISQDIISDRATALRANSFTRTGYTFAGWNTQADGLGTPYTNSQSVTITSGLDLFAKWTANPNTVTFNANDGSAGTATQSINSGAATALTANSFSRTGYRFAGWNTQANGSGTTYTNGQIVTLTSGLTLFARWNKN